jgi:hypothetical protein
MYSPAGAKFAKAGNSLRVSSKNSKANRIETGETSGGGYLFNEPLQTAYAAVFHRLWIPHTA